jgi:hypothetical protein
MHLPEERLTSACTYEAYCVQFPEDVRVETLTSTALFGVVDDHDLFRAVEVLALQPMEVRRVTLPDGRHALVHRRAVN